MEVCTKYNGSMKGSRTMYQAVIKDRQLLAEYRFGSNSFKWVYHAALKFAKHQLYKHPDISCLIVNIEDGEILIAVSRSGITLDLPGGVYEIDKEVI